MKYRIYIVPSNVSPAVTCNTTTYPKYYSKYILVNNYFYPLTGIHGCQLQPGYVFMSNNFIKIALVIIKYHYIMCVKHNDIPL